MIASNHHPMTSAVFLTFSGNCKEALTFYQTCFGGTVRLETFEKELQGYVNLPVVSGSFISDSITIHGSDLVHNEGRILGNHVAIFIQCPDISTRKTLLEKLAFHKEPTYTEPNQKLIEIVDAFDIRWILGI